MTIQARAWAYALTRVRIIDLKYQKKMVKVNLFIFYKFALKLLTTFILDMFASKHVMRN